MKIDKRIISFYLPQFHPTPENDEWWGKGFTEWTNVTKAKPLFRTHHQPNLPGELGFYDLRIPEVREQQASLAKEHGIEGFCYWHYWFGEGKRLLDMPFREIVNSGKPDFPFCLCWCNVSWGGKPYGDLFSRMLMEQKYPGKEDVEAHFYEMLPAFADKRYMKISERNIFLVYNPKELPYTEMFMETWQQLAKKEGVPGFYFIAYEHGNFEYEKLGYDAIVCPSPSYHFKKYDKGFQRKLILKIRKKMKLPKLYRYDKIVDMGLEPKKTINYYPNIFPNWDHSPRSKNKANICIGSTPELFGKMLRNAIECVKDRPVDQRIVFVKAWNEWAEGNYLEPDLRFGRGYLNEIKKIVVSAE